MTSRIASFLHRAIFLIGKTTCYVESRDEINCRDHGPEPYVLLHCTGAWHRVCSLCFTMVLPDAKEALPLTKTSPYVCEEQGCDNDAAKNDYCTWCRGHFCVAHMYDNFLCINCNAEIDDKEVTNDPSALIH
jgi:hypothetical protein